MLLRFLIALSLFIPVSAHAEKSECMVQKRRIDAAMATAHSCSTDADCTIVSLGCLGCNIALNGNQNSASGDLSMFMRNCEKTCPATNCPAKPDDMKVRCQGGMCQAYVEVKVEPETEEEKAAKTVDGVPRQPRKLTEPKKTDEEPAPAPSTPPAPTEKPEEKKDGPVMIY